MKIWSPIHRPLCKDLCLSERAIRASDARLDSLLDMVPERERHIHPKLSRPITGDRVGVWRTRLSAFEMLCHGGMPLSDLSQLDYQLRFSGACWRPLLNITAGSPPGRAPHKTCGYWSGTPEPLPRRIYL